MKKTEKLQLSPKAEAAWGELDEKTRKEIQKKNPFKIERDQAIRELKAKGLRLEILAELTGLNRTSIFRIAPRGYTIPDCVKKDVKGLTRAFEGFLKSLLVILADRGWRGDE